MADPATIAEIERENDEVLRIAGTFEPPPAAARFLKPQDELSVRRFLRQLGYPRVMVAMSDAALKVPHNRKERFRYFCGICWAHIKEAG